MDNALVEQVVRKEKDVRYYLNVILIILCTLGIPAIFILISNLTGVQYWIIVAVFALMFSIYGAWFFISSLRVDYEYACLTNTMRFDKIISKRRRRPIVKFDIKSVTDFFPYDDKEMSKHKLSKVFHASAKEFSKDNYVMVFPHAARGECAVIFTPNEELLEAIRPFFSAELKKKLYFSRKS